MKRKILPIFLSAAMIAGSLTPAYGAEVFGDSAEAVVFEQEEAPEELFSAGADETEAVAKEETADAPILKEETEDAPILNEDAEGVPSDIRFISGPRITEYWYGYDMVKPSDVNCSGMWVEIVYKDGETCKWMFGDEDAYVGNNYVEDEYVNLFHAEIVFDGDYEEYLPVGEYTVKVTFEGKDFVSDYKIRVKDPTTDSSMQLLGISAEEKKVTRVDFGKTSEALLRFTAPKDGVWAFSDTFEYGDGVRVLDDSFKELEREYVGENVHYHFKGGKTYYVYALPGIHDEGDAISHVDITTECIPEVVSLKVAKEPARKEVYKDLGLQLPGLALEIGYSNGKKEVIYPASFTPAFNGEMIEYKFNCPGNEYEPPKGTFDMTYSIGGQSVTFKDVKVKDKNDFPLINGKGKATVHKTAGGTAYVRLKTGKYNRYMVKNSKSDTTYCIGSDAKYMIRNGKPSEALPMNQEVLLFVGEELFDYSKEDFTKDVTFEVTPVTKKTSISKTNIKLSTTVGYTGKAVKPKVTLIDGNEYGGYTLKEGTDYTVTYSNNKNIGTGKVTIKAKGNNYTGSVTKTFKIALGTPKLKSAKSTKAKSVTLTWNKVTGATSYKVYVKVGSKWKAIGTTKGTSFVHNSSNKYYKAQSGKTYTYTVKAERKSGSKTYTSSYNKTGIKAKVK